MNKKVSSIDCDFEVADQGYSVIITVKADAPVFNYKEGAQVIVDAVVDSAMQYYSMTEEDWKEAAKDVILDS